MSLKVNCYSGYTYAQRPRSFVWEGKEYEVASVQNEWFVPGERHFKVRTTDNKFFELCYNETSDEWRLIELAGG